MSTETISISDSSRDRLVVIGSSAGGIEALSTLVGGLRADFPAPIVLAQHLDPARPSLLKQILERHSQLPIVLVEDSVRLEAGKIYVVPANRHVWIQDGHVGLESDHRDRPRPSVDLLFSSAAESYGERLVAVVLTGSGSDGAAGAVDVKEAGGTVVIENPETARYPGMPMALPPTVVDHVVDLNHLAPLLYDVVQGVALPVAAEPLPDVLKDIFAQVSRSAKIDFRTYKQSTILRRIGRRMAVTHTHTLQEYLEYLRLHTEEVGELVMAFLIKVTEFFRDPQAFDYLKKETLPELIAQARARGRVLRIWSAGCATGEEPHSLAILLADLLAAELPEWSVKIFATDLDEAAIAYARRGVYPKNMLKSVLGEYLERYFEPVDQGYRISKEVRQMVIFGQQDLTRGVPFPRIDMIVCRNLLIYFNPELQQKVLDLFAFSLYQTKGYLVLGKAETTKPARGTYELVNKKWKLYRCTAHPFTPIGHVPGLGGALLPFPSPGRRATRYPAALERPAGELSDSILSPADILELRRFNELVYRSLPVGIVMIDRGYHVLSANGAARRLLGVHEVINDQDFLHSARGLPYGVVRDAIDTVFRERTSVTLSELHLETTAGNGGRYLSLTVFPVQAETASQDVALILISDSTEAYQTRRRLEAVQAEQEQLVGELTKANKRLSEINKDVLDTNEELQAANEELVLAHEELQATNEELEATNEELQATNEELETSNEELQATNEELATTNDELIARTNELQEVSNRLASERTRLIEMVELAPFYILLLGGPSLQVEALNPLTARLLGGQEALGRSLEAVGQRHLPEEVVNQAREAFRQDRVLRTPRLITAVQDDSGKVESGPFVFTLVPTHDSAGKVHGLVVYAEDVARQVAREAEQRLNTLKLMVEHAGPVALALCDAATGELLQASSRFLEIVPGAGPSSTAEPRNRIGWSELAPAVLGEAGVETLHEVVQSGQPRRLSQVRVRLPTEQQESIWEWTLTPITIDNSASKARPDEVKYVVAAAVEVTQFVRQREEIERLDRMKDEFLSMASHELRTPLVPLLGHAEMLEDVVTREGPQKPSDWEQRVARHAQRIIRQVERLDRLIDDLLDVSRLQSGKFALTNELVSLNEIVEQALEELRTTDASMPIRLETPVSSLLVMGDRGRLSQVVSNLVTNALIHAPSERGVDVRLIPEPPAPAAGHPSRARIEVRDYGPGIAPEDQSLLFTRFYQVARKDRPPRSGLGLGLYIGKQIAEQHGGTIELHSEPGQGSTFTFHLPLASGNERGPDEPESPPQE